MSAARTILQPAARRPAAFVPPLPQAAAQEPPRAVPRAAPPATPAAGHAESPLRSSPPAPPPDVLAAAARARWSARVTLGSILVIAGCALTEIAEHADALGSPVRSTVLMVGAACLPGAALGWRRARSLRSEVASLREALRAARDAERWHRSVVEEMNDAVLVASPEGRMVEVNHAAAVLLGQDRDALLGRRLWDLLPLDDRLVALRRGDMVLAHGGGLRRLLRRDGSVVAADVTWSTLDDGRMIYLVRRFGQW